jgi:phage shock protein PspC (stress-responsive transcriptional regulator)
MSRCVRASTVVIMSPTASEPGAVMTDMWQTRPTRRQTDRKIAGVASALARRYELDPILVRIAFVVSAFCGVGIPLYLAGWIVLPPDIEDPPRGAGQTSPVTRVLVYVALVLACLHSLHRLAEGGVGFLVGLLIVGVLLYLLQVSRSGHRPDIAYTAEQPAQGAGAPGPAPGGSAPEASRAATPSGPRAPFGERAPSAAAGPRAPRSRLTPVTLALALLAAGVTGVVTLSGVTGFPGSRAVVAVALAVIGVGLLVGSFTRGGRGLVLIALPLMLVGFMLNWAPAQHWRGAGDLTVVPRSISTLAPRYEHSFGDLELDLRNLDLTVPAVAPGAQPLPPGAAPGAPPPVPATASGSPLPGGTPATPVPATTQLGEPVRTVVSVQFGEVTVLVPANADVRVHCHAAIGEVDCLGDPGDRYGVSGNDGPTADAVIDSLGYDNAAGGRPLEIDVNVGTGSVEVRRG